MYDRRINIKGFTLIEIMVALAIIAILMGVGTTSYDYYVKKAKLAETVIFQGKLISDFKTAFLTSGQIPIGLGESIVKPKKNKKVKGNKVKMTSSEIVDSYQYFYVPRNKRAYVTIFYNKKQFPDCGGNCSSFIGFQVSKGGDLYSYCGRWTTSKTYGKFPLDLLGSDCQEECVSCKLNKAKRLN
jgi:prepilin-type N-terminal cleavage/methylation domain-containing protein